MVSKHLYSRLKYAAQKQVAENVLCNTARRLLNMSDTHFIARVKHSSSDRKEDKIIQYILNKNK